MDRLGNSSDLMEKTCIWAITPGGLKTGMKIMAAMPAARFLVSRSIADSYEIPEEAKIEC